jgi:hypothetical protein
LARLALSAQSEDLAQSDLLEDPERMDSPEVLALKVKLEVPDSMDCRAKTDATAHQALNPAQLDQLAPLVQLASTALQEKTVYLADQVNRLNSNQNN